MNLLGVYIGLHDSSIALSQDGVVRYAKAERVHGVKHLQASLSFVAETLRRWDVRQLDLVAYSDGDRNGLGACKLGEFWREVAPVEAFGDARTILVDHHYAHIMSAWPLVSTADIALGFAVDGRGDNEARHAVIANPGGAHPELVFHNRHRSFGRLLERIGELMDLRRTPGNENDLAGKVMGAQAYGGVDTEYIASLDLEDLSARWYALIEDVPWRGAAPAATTGFFSFDNARFRDWLATVHHALLLHTVSLFERFAKRDDAIVYSGGCAQNVIVNQALCERFPRLVIPPHCYDGGLSLGCLEVARLRAGAAPFEREGYPYWQDDNCAEQPSLATIERAADLLAAGHIVGWFQGRGEIGPRALGNRSILMNPARANGKAFINARVKHREAWRPYGASVLREHASAWFAFAQPSPFMLRAVDVLPAVREQIASVVHVDGTSRIQTVDEGERGHFRQLLQAFFERTGVPLLLNTSLNGGGSPIFSSREQCRTFFEEVDIDAVVMGNEVLSRVG